MPAEDAPPFEVWRIVPGDRIRIRGHLPEIVTVTDSGSAGPEHDWITWEAPPGSVLSSGRTVVPRYQPVDLLACEDPAQRIWLTEA